MPVPAGGDACCPVFKLVFPDPTYYLLATKPGEVTDVYPMDRSSIVQTIINRIGAKTYLEIGVRRGKVLRRIKCQTVIGVDPCLKLPWNMRIMNALGLTRFKTFPVTSDDFFSRFASQTLASGLDVAFVDGLHSYEQAWRDIENCLRHLSANGVIVIHDCNPLNSAQAYPVTRSIDEVLELASRGELPGWNGNWNGDVWKAIAHTRIMRKDVEVFTLDLDWGLGVIVKGKSAGLSG
jgi:hypothetical protein